MRGVENNLQALSDAGIRAVAISVDSPEINREYMLQKSGYTFTFLSDPKLEAIRRYDLVHAGQGEKGADVARPAEFLIDPSGTVSVANDDGESIPAGTTRTDSRNCKVVAVKSSSQAQASG